MENNKFCCVENFSVIIPYRELEKMLEVFDITLKDYVAVCGNEYVCMKNQR